MPAAPINVPLPPVEEDEPLLHVQGGALTDELLLRKLRAVFHYLVIGEIRRVLAPDQPAGVASAILTLCAIDFLGSLYAGADATGATLKAFVADFLPGYAPERLSSMRNRLVHNYVNLGGYTFTAGRDRRALHNASTPSPLIVIDVLLEDVQAAAERLFAEAWQDPANAPGSKVIKRAKEPGLMWMATAEMPETTTPT